MGKSFFRYDIRCSIFNGGMLLSIILSLLILLQSLSSAHIFSTDSNMDYLSITLIPLATSGYVPFACFFAVFPYAFSFLEEYNSGYIKYILLRMDRKRYLRQKIIAVSISGGVAMVIPFFFIFFLALVYGEPVTSECYPQIYETIMWGKYMFIAQGIFVLALRLVLIFLFGVVWAEIALLISMFFSNRYVVFVVPFVLYQILWFVLPGSYFNPALLFRSDFDYTCPLWVPYVIQVGISILLVFLISTIFDRKRVV